MWLDVLDHTPNMQLELYVSVVWLNDNDTLVAAQLHDGADVLATLLGEVSEASDSIPDLTSSSSEV